MDIGKGLMRSVLGGVALWCAVVVPATGLPLFSLSQTQSGGVVHVSVTASGASDLFGYQFSLNFDPAVLHATTVSEGPFLATGGATFFDNGTTDNTVGQVSFIFDTLLSAVAGVNGGGVLATIDLSALRFPTLTSLSLSDVLAVDSHGNVLATQTQGLTFSVAEPSMLALLAIALVGITLSLRRHGRA